MISKKGLSAAIVLALLLAVVVQPLTIGAQDWTKDPRNPVVDIGIGADPDAAGIGAACVRWDRADQVYKMWYTAINSNDVFAIGYATSPKGIGWTKQGVVLSPTLDWEAEGVGAPCVIKAGPNDYRMWYTGYQDVAGSLVPVIGYSTSPDGINGWDTNKQPNPVLEGGGGTWDVDGALAPWVIKESDISYKMWYTGRAGDVLGTLSIGYATSANGTGWTPPGANPVFSGTQGWESGGVGVGCVIKESSDNYTLWYSGYSGANVTDMVVGIGYVESTNGIDWGVCSMPILSTSADSWETFAVGAPSVIRVAEDSYRLWYSGVDGLNPQICGAYKTVTAGTTFYLGWNMFSFYIAPAQVAGDFGALLGDEISPLFVYWYEGGYEAYPTLDVTAQPGKGYWVMAFAAEVPIAVDGLRIPTENFTISLTKGWNLIGYPFTEALLWKDCMVKDLDHSEVPAKIILGAFDASWIDKYFFWYQAEGGAGYQLGEPNETSWLQPWHAMWVKSKINNAQLIIPPPGG